MEEILLRQVKLRLNALSRGNTAARDLLVQVTTGDGVQKSYWVGTTLRLKQMIEAYDRDASRLAPVASNESAVELLNEGLLVQMEAEATLVELETCEQCTKEASVPDQGRDAPRTTTRLPKLNPTTFDGDLLRWSEFWDQFQANIGSTRLQDVEKLSYLMGLLEGKALDTVKGLSITNENFNVAVETLKTRYGSKDRVIDAHYKEINKISKCSDNADDALKKLDSLERHLRVLQSLGEDIETRHLRTLILEKFSERILYEVNVRLPDQQTVARIREVLRNIITAMELSQANSFASTSQLIPLASSTEALHVRTHEKEKVYRQPRIDSSRVANNETNRKHKLEYTSRHQEKRLRRSCIFCDEKHYNDECHNFPDIQARMKKLMGRCFKCFGSGHQAKECRTSIRCYHCAGQHNRALCQKRKKGTTNNSIHTDIINSTMSKANVNSGFFLQTATAKVVQEKEVTPCRILLDCGSQRSYITINLAKCLKLTPDKEDLLMIFTFGAGKPTETLSPSAEITIETKRGVQKNIRVNIVPHITDRIAVPCITSTELIDVPADDGSVGQGIDILIGNDYYFSFIRSEKIMIDDNLHLVDTDFGWIVSGRLDLVEQEHDNILSVVTYHQTGCNWVHYTEPDLPLRNLDIKFLWTLENIGITDSVKATREEEAVQHFNNTVKYQDGRYYVKWPWTQSHPSLPTNYGPAYGRLKGLLLRSDKPALEEYDNILQEQIQANIIEAVEPESDLICQTTPPIHYLPHHMVKQCGKRGRIVYDASAKSKELLSLNECLYRGPCMLQDLTALLVNFRMNKIGILADVEKAFLQVGLQPEDRDVTRFLWVKNIEKPLSYDNILHLRFCRVPFGIISSPFLLTAVIRYHISSTNAELLQQIANKCYVDNLVTGANSTEEAVKLFEETRRLFQQISMNIRDWESNDDTLIEKIPQKCRAKPTQDTKVLGLVWNKEEDTLRLNINDSVFNENGKKTINKREVLRTLASIYDPCGFVAPLLMPIKLFLQELWKNDYKWNTPLSPELEQEWRNVSSVLHDIKDVQIPRYTGFHGSEHEENVEYELHCFTDASKQNFATVAYLRGDDGRNVKITLLMSKTRVAPLDKNKASETGTNHGKAKKQLTIPQMELLGYLIGSRLLIYLKRTVTVPIVRQYLWTDSLVVLSWVKSKKLLPPFVANRVEEIKQDVSVENCYVNSRQNPADVATRPELWQDKKQLWLQGPEFLLKKRDMWPKDRHLEAHIVTLSAVAEGLEAQLPEVTKESEVCEEERDRVNQHEDSINKDNLELETTTKLTGDTDSEVRVLKEIQSNYYPEEITGKETHLSRNLGLFMDVDGLLRCGGRMMHAELPYEAKHPILLPRDCEMTMKIIRSTHEKHYHVGVPHTLSIIRQKYWIPQGRSQVQKVIRRCPQCVKHGGGPYKLPMAPALPPERVKYCAPFAFMGMDYFGPMMVKGERGKEKRWVCLFTCLVVRAVHLEVVEDLSAEECLLALRRLVASRGAPSLILSDNAQQFKLTSELLTSAFCVEKEIKWRFIPQLAPWHGGVYERLVGVVKNCLKRTLSKHLLGDSQMQTVIKEVEAVVNTRPLTCVGADLDYVLRPADFLSLGKCFTMDMSNDQTILVGTTTKRDLIEGWKRGQTIVTEFKDMFMSQYLPSLRERVRQNVRQPRVKTDKTPRVGDIVQIKSETRNRQNWKVGRISSVIISEDGECRVARVRVGNTELTRSVGHLYPLEADIDNMSESVVLQEKVPTDIQETRERTPEEINSIIHSQIHLPELPMDIDEVTVHPGLPSANETREYVSLESNVGEAEISLPEETVNPESVEQPTLQSVDNVEDSSKNDRTMERRERSEVRVRRVAADKAREKIAEWTRQLMATLVPVASVATSAIYE